METEVFTAAAKRNTREKAKRSKSVEKVGSQNRPHWKHLQGGETNETNDTLKVKKRSARQVCIDKYKVNQIM